MNSSQKKMARFVCGGIIAVALGLAGALYNIQVRNGASYASKANTQYAKPMAGIFDRGTIFLSSKAERGAAAAVVSGGFVVYANPSLITNDDAIYEALSQYVSIDPQHFAARVANKSDTYEELVHRITPEVAQSVTQLHLPGIGATQEGWRSYPGGSLAAHAIGIIGQNEEGVVAGRYGLERYYDEVLSRTEAESSSDTFAQLFAGIKDSFLGGSEKKGDLVTTIEQTVQHYTEKVLTDTSALWHPDEIGAIIIDPHTGDIVAMASLPTFDPNDLSGTDISVLSNPLVEHVYEMGSIMKPLTMAVGLDTGVITPASTYDDTGFMNIGDRKISNYDARARGVVNVQQILSQSLNVGAATVGLKIGKDDFRKYFLSFGFASSTGIDLPNEADGIVKNLNSGTDIAIATASYGQGIAVSPIAMTKALSILANGGYAIQPRLVREIQYIDGSRKAIPTKTEGPFLKTQTVTDVATMLVEVVDTALSKGAIKRESYSVAAKTGTAEIADPVNGGYFGDRYLHSFFGFFPAYNPKFLVFLYQIHPRGAQFASETLTKPFDELATFLIDYYNIPPDR